MSIREQVQEFCRVYGHHTRQTPGVPGDIKKVKLCIRLITEEFCEFLAAVTNQPSENAKEATEEIMTEIGDEINIDLVEMTDALADLDYVVEFCRQVFGINGEPVADEVQRSNMSKLGPDGKPMFNPETGKTVKGPNFTPPDIDGELRKQGWLG